MSTVEILEKLNKELIEHVKHLAIENTELKLKLSNCEGKIEVLSKFYADFSNQYETKETTDKISSEKTEVKKSKYTTLYDTLLSKYFLLVESGISDPNVVRELFEDFEVDSLKVLIDIHEVFPLNINVYVKKYGYEKEYKILLKSLELKKKFKNPEKEKNMVVLINNYIDNFNAGKKMPALKYARKVLIFFPLEFNNFLNEISQYQYDGFDEYIEEAKLKLYGRNNFLLKNWTPKKNRSRKNPNFTKMSLNDLLLNIQTTPKSKRQKAIRILKKWNKSEEDRKIFIDAVNLHLQIKLEY